MVRIRPRVAGISVAPDTPCSTRAPISISGLVENAATTDAMPKPAAPMSRSLRLPTRSPNVPIVMSSPANTNE